MRTSVQPPAAVNRQSLSKKAPLLLRARIVVPVTRPPLLDAGVLIQGNRIAKVRRWSQFSPDQRSQAIDLGDVALLPGLVNAHCHLDYTNMAGQLPPPKLFTDWLKLITSAKAGWSRNDFGESWLHGAQMLLSTGTTTVGDIEAYPELLPSMWEATPLRVLSFFELIGITGRRKPAEIVREATGRISLLRASRFQAGLSPHAPYSTLPELLRLSAKSAKTKKWRMVVHVAESELEYEMFEHARGEMYKWLARSGRDMTDCGGWSPIQHLHACGLLGTNLLAVHVNYLKAGDADLLGQHGVNVVHCPRSHFYFEHAAFPLSELRKARVPISLGTDSLASVYKRRHESVELSMFEEMRLLARRDSSLSAIEILEMATINGSKALGFGATLGQLAPRGYADLITIPYRGPSSGVYEAIVNYQGHVLSSMIDGRWAVAPRLN